MKKPFKPTIICLWILAFVLPGLAGCAGSPAQQPSFGQKLVIYNWTDYMDQGVIDEFEKAYRVEVLYNTYESNEEMLKMVAPLVGKVDLVVPTDYIVHYMRENDFLSPLHKENISNWANLNPELLDQEYDPGNRFCVPYLWGTTGLAYNIDLTGREISSWEEFFSPEFYGRAAMLDDARMSLGAVLLYLGYDQNTTNPVEIHAARDFLTSLGKSMAYSGETDDELAAGKYAVVYGWNGDIKSVSESNPAIRYVIPKEGSMAWLDNMCILKNAPNQRLAEEFINFVLSPQIGARLANYVHYPTPNLAALEFIDKTDMISTILYPSENDYDRMYYIENVDNATTSLYNDAWQKVISQR